MQDDPSHHLLPRPSFQDPPEEPGSQGPDPVTSPWHAVVSLGYVHGCTTCLTMIKCMLHGWTWLIAQRKTLGNHHQRCCRYMTYTMGGTPSASHRGSVLSGKVPATSPWHISFGSIISLGIGHITSVSHVLISVTMHVMYCKHWPRSSSKNLKAILPHELLQLCSASCSSQS